MIQYKKEATYCSYKSLNKHNTWSVLNDMVLFINDMFLGGLCVQNLVESNTYVGLTAQLKFNEWKKWLKLTSRKEMVGEPNP